MTKIMSGMTCRAALTEKPDFTPRALASRLTAMQLVCGESSGTTPTGFPRSDGLKCCSAEAKKLSKSR